MTLLCSSKDCPRSPQPLPLLPCPLAWGEAGGDRRERLVGPRGQLLAVNWHRFFRVSTNQQPFLFLFFLLIGGHYDRSRYYAHIDITAVWLGGQL